MDRIPHPLEIGLAKQFGHGWSGDSAGLWYKHGVIAFLVAAAVVTVVLHIVMQKSGFATDWAVWVIRISLLGRCFRRPLKATFLTPVFLMSMWVFSKAMKTCFVVAFRAADLIQFCHEDSSPFGSTLDLW